MSTTSFKVHFSDNTVPKKKNIIINANAIDASSTSLVLHGPGSSNYANDLWSNMVQIMEHFCSASKPTHPTEGQIWYNPTDKTLKVYSTSDTDYQWYDLFVNNPTSKSPKMELDPESLNLLNSKLDIAGGTMTGMLILPSEEYNDDGTPIGTALDNPNAAVTRRYVEGSIQAAFQSRGTLQSGNADGSGNSDSEQIYSIVGNVATVEGVIGGGSIHSNAIFYTSGVQYGNIYTVDVEFPDEVKPYSTDIHTRPNYTINASCELTHTDATINGYLKANKSCYPVEAINLTVNGFTLKTTVGLIFDDDQINRSIQVLSFKYTVVGRKQ